MVVPRDTTPIRYVLAWNNVKMYRSDLQAACDSMVFCELDSIARLYGEPILWNDVRNQLTAEEMQLLMKDGAVTRGSMITDAWLISQQDSVHFDQIKSTEMLGYFRDNQLYRFDALGGVSAIFYMLDENVITTINVKESKSLTAAMKDGQAQRLLYMESIKSDAYPVAELAPEKQKLKNFKWRGDERPVSQQAITTRSVRTSERARYEKMLRPLYRETNKYFDNYIFNLIDSLNAVKLARMEQRQREKDSLARLEAGSPVEPGMTDGVKKMTDEGFDEPAADSVVVAPVDTLRPRIKSGVTGEIRSGVTGENKTDEIAVPVDSVKVNNVIPGSTNNVIPGSTGDLTPASPETVVQSQQLTRAEKRALRRAERKARREARRAARLARRAERAARRR